MKIIEPSFCLEPPVTTQQEMLEKIERAARVCYKSEKHIKPGSAQRMVEKLINSGHHSVFEHVMITARIICDRGVSHELVRHRLASYSQESTRYANYSKEKFGSEITVIRPVFWEPESAEYEEWHVAMANAEVHYFDLLDMGASPQAARSVLPNSLKTEVVMTANIREWWHVFKLRALNNRAHPQIRQVMVYGMFEMAERWPGLFSSEIMLTQMQGKEF